MGQYVSSEQIDAHYMKKDSLISWCRGCVIPLITTPTAADLKNYKKVVSNSNDNYNDNNNNNNNNNNNSCLYVPT
jgi:hypothetical protein